jgi:2-keto-4-pentenoate hydratase
MSTKLNFLNIAKTLYDSFENKQAISPITETYPSITVEDAYQIQRELVNLHKKNGRTVVGNKIGLTSEGIQKQINVYEPDFGVIFSEFVYESGAEIVANQMIYPRIEAEIAFILDKDLKGPNLNAIDVLAATKAVLPSFEVIDSRVKDWKIKISDTIADNGSHWGMVLGNQIASVNQLDLRQIGLVLERDGKVLGTAAGATVLGHPASSVAWLANKLSQWDETLKAGSIVLSGSFTPAFDLLPGHYKATFGEGLSSVEVLVK